MKEIYVRRDMMGDYSGVNKEEAMELVETGGYCAICIQADDRIIYVLFWAPFGADDDKLKEEAFKYFRYIESITGIEFPAEEIEMM